MFVRDSIIQCLCYNIIKILSERNDHAPFIGNMLNKKNRNEYRNKVI